jgi:hypothetical protein
MYKYILEHCYGKMIERLCLVFLHPLHSEYLIVEVPNLQNEIQTMLEA